MQENTVQVILAANIRRVRKSMKLTQAELAEKVGISNGYMCDIERSRRWPSAENLSKIAETLRLAPFQLLLPTVDSPYFDRHRTLTAFSRELQETFARSTEEVLDKLVLPFGSPLNLPAGSEEINSEKDE